MVHDREQARDIAQEAFAQLFTRWRRVSKYERPDAWVRRVAIRMAVRAIRRERLRRRREHQFDRARPLGPVDIDVLRAVAKLPAAQRAAVVLFYLEDRPVAEVAETLACSRGHGASAPPSRSEAAGRDPRRGARIRGEDRCILIVA